MRVLFLFLFISLICIPYRLNSQEIYSDRDMEIFNDILAEADRINLSDSALDKIVVFVGRQFIGSPYVGGILDKHETERLVVDLSRLDCVTFLESTMALSMMIREKKWNLGDFCNKLSFLRYRNGMMNGYASRLHYFTEWIHNNQQKGILEDVTQAMGGKPFTKSVHMMSSNRDKYSGLKDDASLEIIKKVEQELTSMNKHYIPKTEISQVEDKIMEGDLIALATNIDGLEIAHVGIAIWLKTGLHLMHASSLNKKVEISEVTLADFVRKKSSYTGIIVARMSIPSP